MNRTDFKVITFFVLSPIWHWAKKVRIVVIDLDAKQLKEIKINNLDAKYKKN